MKVKKIPLRTCVVTHEQRPKKELVRVVRDKDGVVSVDLNGKAPGRGAYLTLNKEVILKLIKQNDLCFEELFRAKPHVFISLRHPLAEKKKIRLEELEDYPYLSFEQGEYNSFYFAEEILSTLDRRKNIKVRDRATLFNLVIGLNGYTVSSGIISRELNGENIIARPLVVEEEMIIGTITQKNMSLSRYGKAYMEALKRHLNAEC